MEMIRSAVIGIGGIGKWHGQMMRDTGKMEVCAVCDTNEKMREVAKEHFPGATFYTSVEKMLDKEKLDLVSIVVPHDLHAPFAISALNAGVNVIVEKPMATKYADCLAMIDAAEKNDRFITVFHNRRLDGWYLAAKSVIDDGLLGNLYEINTGIHFAPGPDTWRGYKKQSGGIVYDWGVHLLDYAVNFANSEVKGVSGYFHRTPGSDPLLNEGHGTVRVFFESGIIANVTVSALDRVNPLRYRIMGDKGTLLDEWNWKDNERNWQLNDKLKVYTKLSGGEQAEMAVPYRQTVAQKYYDNVASRLLHGTPLMVTAESAARLINIFNTAEQSSLQGGVLLPLAEAVAVGK
ncbi:MAG: Gfo/Idh/MocA family protein [Armatimonadota bacterium]